MSIYWGYHCKTCDVASETWLNHGDDCLRVLARYAPMLRQLEDESTCDIWIQVGGYSEPLLWLREHAGHNLELINEYNATAALIVATASVEERED
jgi:hypothetical protein